MALIRAPDPLSRASTRRAAVHGRDDAARHEEQRQRSAAAPYVAYCMIGPAVGGSPGWLLTVLSTCSSTETTTAPTTPPQIVPSPPTTAMMT